MDEIEIEQNRLDALMLQKEKRIGEIIEENDGFFEKPKHRQTTPKVINRV